MAISIESVFPSDEAVGVPTGVSLFVIFDREVDPTTLDRAIVMTGPDSDRWTGPDLQLFDRSSTPAPEFYLDSPGYTGIVQGTFEVVKLTSSGTETEDATYSYGSAIYKSKIVFTPNDHLATLTEFTLIVSGDELDSDDLKVGISSRTVFDIQLGTNLGDGSVSITGGYTGTLDDEFVIVITVAGDIGTSTYNWYRTSDPLNVHTGTTSSHEVLLEDGVYLSCSGDNFLVDDEFRANVRPSEYMSGSMTWTFQTGSGSITTVPSTTSTSEIGATTVTGSSSVALSIASSFPENLTSQVSLDTNTITVVFSQAVDPTTITQDTVKVKVSPIRGVFTGNSTLNYGDVPKSLSLSLDNKTLTIKI